jgi:hypothetical protein
MEKLLYTIASSRKDRAFRVAFCLVWLFLMVELVVVDYKHGIGIFSGDHGMVVASIILGSAVWTLSTVQAFVNRTVFTEDAIEQRMLLRGTKTINYSAIRKTYVRGGKFFKVISVLANDGNRILITGTDKQLACVEQIVRERSGLLTVFTRA